MNPLPNRLAVYATALGALALGLLPLVGNLDWTSTAGVLGAIAAIGGVVGIWLFNWGKYERAEGPGILPAAELDELDEDPFYDELADDEFDEQSAEPIPPVVAEAAHTPEGTTYTPAPGELEGGGPSTPGVPPPGPRPGRRRP